MLPNRENPEQPRLAVTITAVASITYCLIVIWYVATFPDIGLRCLLPMSAQVDELQVTQFIHEEDECSGERVLKGQWLSEMGGKRAGNFLLFVHHLAALRSAEIPPGGMLHAGADPSENKTTPPLVEINNPDKSPIRMVKLILNRPQQEEGQSPVRAYVPIKPMEQWGFVLTVLWFLCQLMILGVAMTAFWQRPSDRVVQVFCLMCSASMPAFVGGFHWWILAASPLLNLPFIFAACLLPAVTLDFFSRFPRENFLLKSKHNRWHG